MKINKIFLVGVILLTLISLAPLCASENITDDLSTGDNQIVEIVQDDCAIADGEKEDMDYNITYATKINEGEDKYIDISLPNDSNGKLEFGIDDNETSVLNLVDGKTKYSIKDLTAGQYTLKFSYTNDTKYNDWDTSLWLLISNPLDCKIEVANEIYTDVPTKITLTTPRGFEEGFIRFNYDGVYGVTYEADLENGSAIFDTTFTHAGNTTVSYLYWSQDPELNKFGGEQYFTVNVIAKPIIEAKTLTLFSTQSKDYKIRLLDGNGNVIAGEKVTFYLDGKKIKTIETNKKGYATVKIGNMAPDTYKIKIKYKAISVSKTVKVKNVIKPLKSMKANNVDKIVFKANTNKVNGKYLKGKTVTFKFNGKTYKSKINAKGVAQITIKKADLTNCKVKTSYSLTVKLGKEVIDQLVEFKKVKPKISYATGDYAQFYGKV